MHNRRYFLRALTAGGVGLFVRGTRGQAVAQIPGGTLNPLGVPKYQTPMLIPPVMPTAGKITDRMGKNIDYYEISVRQFPQQILPAGFPVTTVWGYGAVASDSKRGLLLHNAPSLTIEAKWRTPVRVKWINDLVDANGNYLPHLLPVDQTLHWANPSGGLASRDTRPTFTSTPGRYTGPVPIVTHVHGAVGVGDESDGYAEAWYLPAAANIPAGYATEGTWYSFFTAKAAEIRHYAGDPASPCFNIRTTPCLDDLVPRPRSGHDSTQRLCRPGRLLPHPWRSGWRRRCLDSRFGTPAVLPGPAPKENDQFPPKKTYYEIPIAIQDRSFNADGSLFYPNTRAFFDGIEGPFIPKRDISPIWNPEFFGNMIMVNGNTWPFQTVERRRYRIRFLNGCQSRFLILNFANIPGVEVWQIGNEGGFLAAPVNLTANHGNQLLMGLAERADLIVDFTNVPAGNYVLGNLGPDEPFGGGVPGIDFPVSDAGTTGQILQFRVVPAVAPDLTTPPRFLRLPDITPLPAPTVIRPLVLLEEMSTFVDDAPTEALLGTIVGNPNVAPGIWTKRLWMDPVTDNPVVGATEVWEMYNATGDAHPMHIHEVVFEVINRQEILVDEEAHEVRVMPGSTPRPREPWETGFKDTVIAYPGQVTRVRAQFISPGQFVWHCHIVEHEDNEMMRPYRIGPMQPGQPT